MYVIYILYPIDVYSLSIYKTRTSQGYLPQSGQPWTRNCVDAISQSRQ